MSKGPVFTPVEGVMLVTVGAGRAPSKVPDALIRWA